MGLFDFFKDKGEDDTFAFRTEESLPRTDRSPTPPPGPRCGVHDLYLGEYRNTDVHRPKILQGFDLQCL